MYFPSKPRIIWTAASQVVPEGAYWPKSVSRSFSSSVCWRASPQVHFDIFANGTPTLTIDIRPNDIHIGQGNASVLAQVIHLTVV